MRRTILSLVFWLAAAPAWATTFTSTTSGNISAGTTWVGGVAPGNGTGDVIVVADGHTVTVETSWTLGSKASGVGHAFTINATNSSTFGTLKVNNGVILTLRGFDATSNTLGLVNQFGLFQPQTGSTVLGDVSTDYASVIPNKGRFEPQTGVTFSVPAGSVAWTQSVASQANKITGLLDQSAKLFSYAFPNPQISNGTTVGSGTAMGSSGNFPAGVSAGGSQGFYGFSGWSTNPNTEVAVTFPATVAQVAAVVNGAGKYAIDYDAGIAYFYDATTTGNHSVSYNYQCLNKASASWRGWGIVSYGAQAGCTCLIDGCTFTYMGAASTASHSVTATGSVTVNAGAPVVMYGHKTVGGGGASGAAGTIGYVKNSTFRSCYTWAQVQNCTGSAGDPTLVTGNTFRDGSGNTNTDGINFFGFTSSYVTIDSNTFGHRGCCVHLDNIGTQTASAIGDLQSLRFTNNTGQFGTGMVSNMAGITGARTPFPALQDPDAGYANHRSTPDLYIGSNTMNGMGGGGGNLDARSINVSGTSGHPAIVELNVIDHPGRIGHMIGSYVTFRSNIFGQTYHHGFTGSDLDDLYCTDVTFQNNLFWNDRGTTGNTQSAAIQAGYNHRCFINNLVISGNTFDGWNYGAFDFGDVVDVNSGSQTLTTNLVVNNNVIANGAFAMGWLANDQTPLNSHALEVDYNVLYSQATAKASGLANTTTATGFYQGSNKYNRLTTGNRNIPSVALFDASYTTAQSGRTLAYTVNTLGSDHTLTWGAGSAVQLIQTGGTCSGAGLRTIADSGNANIALNLTGTVTWSLGSAAVTGSGTAFTTQLQAGDLVRKGGASPTGSGFVYKVSSITDDTHLTLTTVASDSMAGGTAVRHRADFRRNWLWVYGGTGSGQARCCSWASPFVAYSATVNAPGTGYAVNDYVRLNIGSGTYDTPGQSAANSYALFKITSVSGGTVTGLKIISGGAYSVAPTTTAATTVTVKSSGSGLTLNVSYGPGYLLAPDLGTAVDATSTYAVVSSMVTLGDGSGGTVKAGIGMTEPGVGCHAGSVTLPTTSQTDTGITVAVNHSPTGNPNWAGAASAPTGAAADYRVTAGSSAIGAATADNAPATDYFGNGFASTIGFAQFVAAGATGAAALLSAGD